MLEQTPSDLRMRIVMNVTLHYIGKVLERPDWNFPTHQHGHFSELIFVTKGEGVVTIAGERYAVQEGDLLVYNKGVIHEEYSSQNNPLALYYCGIIHPDMELLIPLESCPVMKTKEHKNTVHSLFDLLFEEAQQKRDQYHLVAYQLLSVLVIWVHRLNKENTILDKVRNAETLAIGIKEYLDIHYLRHLTLQDIATEFHMSPFYISHVFHRKYNDSPINYILHRRMAEARQLLVATKLKISVIAHLLGYENANYFSILFTRLMAESPSQYRKRELRERINL